MPEIQVDKPGQARKRSCHLRPRFAPLMTLDHDLERDETALNMKPLEPAADDLGR